jgi:protein tyrosine phosphatase (PTP) superfamily phosphohydrolase (DUF442 family)
LAQVDEIKRVKTRRVRRYVVAFVAAALVVVLIFRNPLFHGNFGVVEPGQVYRSSQPVADLPRIIDQNHLVSILNLRGGSHRDDWYAAEVRATHERGIDFYDLPLSAIRRPRRRELLILLDLFERCRYPLLIHCKSGSDRTGLAAALYRMTRRDEPPDRAMEAFSLKYGHVPLFGPEHLHEPIEEYGAWLKAHHLAHRPERFRAWVEQVYVSDDPGTAITPLEPGPRRPSPHTRAATARP